ncbi:TylF/MycF family methyltransferase [Phenylobacterium sp. LH3H17]|uniref:TylF/MycF/NovP-related O-methyltransferase n=1 Tax=Phenylobacterium sp. LH3H17 TaxID=2903901 RepID=UPI0020CA24AB|nr:TylF/MycF/NovP-related O-methyltransferase [Phenylobacterium sp. LH3H17]UTP39764.1 TylF/MycF family methyltransferase [Phenylobacterium sp. LH3H17]
MPLSQPKFLGRWFFGLTDPARFVKARDEIADVLTMQRGFFASDNLITWEKSLAFLRDDAFAKAFNAHAQSSAERGTIWRLVTLVWAARQAAKLPGDFVECACYRGTSARIVADVVDLSDRRYFLYDLFEHDEAMPHHGLPAHGADLYDEVRARFPEPNVIVTKGRVPDTLAQAAPDKIALLHLDLNNADAEIGTLELLFDRIVPGGILVLDDFGWLAYQPQQRAEIPWFEARGYSVLELPTGQGLVIKR